MALMSLLVMTPRHGLTYTDRCASRNTVRTIVGSLGLLNDRLTFKAQAFARVIITESFPYHSSGSGEG